MVLVSSLTRTEFGYDFDIHTYICLASTHYLVARIFWCAIRRLGNNGCRIGVLLSLLLNYDKCKIKKRKKK